MVVPRFVKMEKKIRQSTSNVYIESPVNDIAYPALVEARDVALLL